MFTIKFYSDDSGRQVIKEAESFTILRNVHQDGWSAEITLHQKNNGVDERIDINSEALPVDDIYSPRRYAKAIIENSAGKTTEIVNSRIPA